MSTCKYCQPQAGGGIYCERFRVFGPRCRLHICTMEQLEQQWTERLERIPAEERERMIRASMRGKE